MLNEWNFIESLISFNLVVMLSQNICYKIYDSPFKVINPPLCSNKGLIQLKKPTPVKIQSIKFEVNNLKQLILNQFKCRHQTLHLFSYKLYLHFKSLWFMNSLGNVKQFNVIIHFFHCLQLSPLKNNKNAFNKISFTSRAEQNSSKQCIKKIQLFHEVWVFKKKPK